MFKMIPKMVRFLVKLKNKKRIVLQNLDFKISAKTLILKMEIAFLKSL